MGSVRCTVLPMNVYEHNWKEMLSKQHLLTFPLLTYLKGFWIYWLMQLPGFLTIMRCSTKICTFVCHDLSKTWDYRDRVIKKPVFFTSRCENPLSTQKPCTLHVQRCFILPQNRSIYWGDYCYKEKFLWNNLQRINRWQIMLSEALLIVDIPQGLLIYLFLII